MKNVIKYSIYMLVMITSIATSYAKDYLVKVEKSGKEKITLTLDNVKAGEQLSIKDDSGIVLYNESIAESGLYNHTFNLTNLPNGSYYFELDKDYQIKIIPFEVISKEVVLSKEEDINIFKPVLKVKDHNIYISKLSLNKADLNIKMYYNSNYGRSGFELIHSETITDEINIERIYSLSKQQKGEYRIDFESNGRSYSEYVSL